MHSIKRYARRAAWYPEDGDGWSPMQRYDSRRQRKAADEEQGNRLTTWQTENDAGPSPIETSRRERDFGPAQTHVPRASTYGGPNASSAEHDRGIDDITSSEGSKGSDEKPVSSNAPLQPQPNGIVDHPVGAENGTRKRKSRKFHVPKFLGGKDEPAEDDNEDMQRTDSAETKGKGKKKFKHKPTIVSQLKAVFLTWVNILLIAVPVGIALNYALGDSHTDRIVVFVVNFIAIIPLAAVLSYSTEELALYIGETMGGLLNATFGNAVELIVSIIALVQGQILIVQTSLIGSMLSNLLLVLGMCFFFGGLRRVEQFFNMTVAQTAASMLALAIGSLIIPTAFWIFAPGDGDNGVTPASRGTAVMLLFTYACYLLFQLRTHVDMYNAPSQKSPKKPNGKKEPGETLKGLATMGAGTAAAAAGGEVNKGNLVHEEEEEEDEPQLTVIGALCTLGGSTVLVALCAEYMVSSISAVSENVSQEFIGLILLPIVGNAAEHVTAVTVAIKDKMDLSIGVAVGSSLQIALLVLPLMVCINWFGAGAPDALNFNFDGFQVSCLFIAVIVVNYVIQDGKSHWLEGILLLVTYFVIAVSAWFYPVTGEVAG
ncbi:hypothetical protein BAUCODRAFT_39061 [Baudoinia panamericana UAMH 10762]|uniref:Sodium/calcium exchanger membrane region domain-containing protein n=1 Tax=Baudoinia panamericana (strain UAMH 10762) TaxID=717646 RepID=M2N009_BAUPA|nr:uncharacterized protein BAUCODRAFT_39061 [Baudoinia panamericana UAMH 10762]EMC91915.1 hypothetical protein BAUCODRAFT_39061 [Baudoinia panamericana UAMH 10762]